MTVYGNLNCTLIGLTENESIATHWGRSLEDICQVRIADRFSSLHEYLKDFRPSVVLIDIDFTGFDVIQDVPLIVKISPESKIIVLTSRFDETEAISIIKAGAQGYALTNGDVLLLRKSVEVIRRGEFWIPRYLMTRLIEEMQQGLDKQLANPSASSNTTMLPTPITRFDQLTRREHQIAELITNGHSNKEIGNLLKISESTVKAHLSAIYHKLGVLDRLSLALLITRQHRKIAETA